MLLVPGDHIAHHVSAKDSDPTGSEYASVKSHLQSTWEFLEQYFPNTVMLPTIGNNDGRYHNEAIDEGDKQNYYSFVYDLWFRNFAGNSSLNLADIEQTLMEAGHYRADITAELTILQMNSMYMTTDDTSEHGNEADIQLTWFEY